MISLVENGEYEYHFLTFVFARMILFSQNQFAMLPVRPCFQVFQVTGGLKNVNFTTNERKEWGTFI